MRAFALFLLQIFVRGFIPGYFRHGPIIRILHLCTFKSPNIGQFISAKATVPCAFKMHIGVKIEEPVINDRWEEGEVSWIFNDTESDGNHTSVLLPKKPDNPLTPVKVYEVN